VVGDVVVVAVLGGREGGEGEHCRCPQCQRQQRADADLFPCGAVHAVPPRLVAGAITPATRTASEDHEPPLIPSSEPPEEPDPLELPELPDPREEPEPEEPDPLEPPAEPDVPEEEPDVPELPPEEPELVEPGPELADPEVREPLEPEPVPELPEPCPEFG